MVEDIGSRRGAKGMVVGLDLGDRRSAVCVMSKDGEVVEEAWVRTTGSGLEGYFGGRTSCRVVLEAGTHSPWVQRLLQSHGHEVMVLNPHRVRLIAESVGKGDREDAAILADIGHLGLHRLRVVEHRSAEAQADLAVLRARDLLVRQRTAMVLHIRGVVKANGGRLVGGVRCPSDQVMKQVPGELHEALGPLVRTVAALSAEIREYEGKIEALIREKYPAAKALQAVPGVGPITALSFVLTLGEPRRFRRSRQVGAYLGLVPRRRQSGERNPELGITKAGDAPLRRLLVQCAHHILSRPSAESELRRWGLNKVEAGGKSAYKRAVVAVARKLAVLLHRLWVSGEVYERGPKRQAEVLMASA